jgi:medium-chain acyl-[acyl-carrier-protein] hydrolase
MPENIRYIWEEDFLVTSADTDFSRKLSISALTNMFIQIAWHHAEELGFGVKYLHENGLAWVLSRFHLKIESLPEWNDTVKMVTWPKGIRRLFYLRDLEIYDKQGNQIGLATSEWLLIDVKSKRPKLQGPDEGIFNKNKDKHAINTEVKNLSSPENIPQLLVSKPKYSDIDLNQHLTTTRYIEWMFDTFDMDFHNNYQCVEMILNFNREISFGEEVSINRLITNQNNQYFFCFKSHTNQEHLKSILTFKTK